MLAMLAAGACWVAGVVAGQERGPDASVQRQAMQKLAFLAGKWVGEARVVRGPGEPLKIEQTEEVRFKLDGLMLLVEGTGRDQTGKVVFSAMAVISYDDATQTYRFRSFSGGHYLDTELKVSGYGFAWGYTSGPLTVKNTMQLDAQGAWVETTETKYGDQPARRTVEMKLGKLTP